MNMNGSGLRTLHPDKGDLRQLYSHYCHNTRNKLWGYYDRIAKLTHRKKYFIPRGIKFAVF